MSVTIEKIANHAGVSCGTVDRVLHNRPHVRPQVRKRVLNAMHELGYHPLIHGAQADTVTTQIAVLIPPWTDSYFNRKIDRGIRMAKQFLNDTSFRVLEYPLHTRTEQEFLSTVDEAIAAGALGLVITPENTQAIRDKIDILCAKGIKVITYDADLPGSGRICHVGQDLLRSGRVAAGLLYKMLNRQEHILVITGNMRMEAHKGRVDGFCLYLQEMGFDSTNYTVEECYEMPSLVCDVVKNAMQKNPKLGGIYMATQSVPGCMQGIAQAKAARVPHVIVNDLTPYAKACLRKGKIDYIVDQSFEQHTYKAIVALYQILRQGRMPSKELYLTDISIVSKEML